jgi:hypothetical protein
MSNILSGIIGGVGAVIAIKFIDKEYQKTLKKGCQTRLARRNKLK